MSHCGRVCVAVEETNHSEVAAAIALEEEKKRKRAEKFGTAKPASTTTETAEPVRSSRRMKH